MLLGRKGWIRLRVSFDCAYTSYSREREGGEGGREGEKERERGKGVRERGKGVREREGRE